MTWLKHDGTDECPVDLDDFIEVETWANYSIKEYARNLEWKYIKFYKVIPPKK